MNAWMTTTAAAGPFGPRNRCPGRCSTAATSWMFSMHASSLSMESGGGSRAPPAAAAASAASSPSSSTRRPATVARGTAYCTQIASSCTSTAATAGHAPPHVR